MKNYKCELCQFFKENTILNPDSGECHRHSPRGMDASGMSIALSQDTLLQAGNISDVIFSEVPVYLYKNNFEIGDEADPLPIGAGTSEGYNDNTITPFLTNYLHQVYKVRVAASLLNVGSGTVGAEPKLKIVFGQVNNNTTTILSTEEIIIPQAQVGVFGNTTDLSLDRGFALDAAIFIPSGQKFCFWIELDDTNSDDYIAEIRNPMLGIQIRRNFPVSDPFSLVPDKTSIWCGNFKPLVSSEKARCWDCDFFEAADVGIDNSGHCRRNAPTKFDQATIPSNQQPSETEIDFTNLFPLISDGTDNFCGDFKLSTGTIPDPV